MHKLKLFWLTAAAVALCACGDDETLTGGEGAGGGGGVGTGGGTGGGGTTTNTVRIGSGFGTSFQQGMLQLGVTSLAAGGSTGVTATLVTSTGDLYTTSSVDVTFNSPCVGQGLATLTTPVKTTTGIASATYVATGCSGPDVITATATVNGTTMTANGTVTVAAAGVGSIQFISATPPNIALQGTGGAGRSENSTVIFRVVDSTGGPVANTNVSFALNSTVGGIALSPATATTNTSGQVQTVVTSGTVATTVRVTATVVGLSIGTQSDQLTVTTGIPDQDSTSLSIETLNPETWNRDGIVDKVTIRLSDRFNNPVPNGTAVTFTAEGGQIVSQCVTTGGACTVDWTSQSPRPTNGRVSILATAIGEESFTDVDGNGRYGQPDSFDDIDEPFRDDNEDGTRQSAEPFYDFNTSGTFDLADGQFNGLLCDTVNPAGDCSPTAKTVAVNSNAVLVMSGCDVDLAPFAASLAAPATYTAIFRDMRGQPLPLGTTITFSTTNGTIVGGNAFTYPNTLTAQTYGVTVNKDATASSGSMFIAIKCPSNLTVNIGPITVTD
jgi:hypothetical protein